MAPETENDLLLRARSGDPEVFGALVKPHLSMFHNAILRILGNPTDAEDALQEALILMHRDLSRFEGRSKFSTWAYPICINAALTLRRSRVSRKEEPLEAPDPESKGDGHGPAIPWQVDAEALSQAEREEMRGLLLKALDGLPDTLRTAFVLKDLEDWSTEAIAEHQGISAVLLRQRLHRARMQVLEAIRGHICGGRPCP